MNKKINKTKTNKLIPSSNWMVFVCTFVLCVVLGFNSIAQISTYTFTSTTGTYTAVSGGTTIIAAGTDDGNSAATAIGFNFTFGGTVFTQFVANSNGNIRFGSVGPTSQYTPISTASNSFAIGGCARDGKTGGAVVTSLTGAVGSRILTIDYPTWNLTFSTAANTQSFQIKLYETSNIVEIIYGPNAGATSFTPQVGLRGSTTASDFNNRTTTTNWSASTAGVQASTMTWSSTVKPANGLLYRWTPPNACTGTPTAGTIPATAGVCAGGSLGTTLNVTGFTTGFTGIAFQWQESDDNGVTDTWANAVGGTGATTSSYTTPVLASSIYYRCKVSCTPTLSDAFTNSCNVTVTNCSFDVNYTTATYTSIMPANGGTGVAMSSWQNGTGDDNTSATQSLAGTSFKYQGATITGFQASSNGWMTFNTSNTSTAYINSMSSTVQNRVLAPFWDDLVFTGQNYANRDANVRYKVDGTLGSGTAVITVEWAGLERFNIAGPNLNFQVKLYEGSNNIEFIYGNFEGFDGTVTSAYSYSIGYNGTNPGGLTAADRFGMVTGVTNHFSTTPNDAQIIMPACNTKFVFTPGTYTGPGSAPAIPVPANDNSGGAISITSAASPCISYCGTYYTSRGATNSSQGQACATTAGNEDDDVWFSFVPANGIDNLIRLRCSPNYDGVLEVLDNTFTTVACVNATGVGLIETIQTSALTDGQTYYVRVFHNGAGIGTSNGQFALCISDVVPPPSNDDICGATNLDVLPTCTPTASENPFTLSATASPQASCTGTPTADVWYSFVASTSTDIVTVQSGAGYNAAMQVYSSSDNTCTGTLTQLACVNATSTAGAETYTGAALVPGNTYFVRVYHFAGGAATGDFNICVTATPPACPSLTSPANTESVSSVTGVTLTWTASAGATGYDVFFDTNPTPTTLVSANQIGLTYATGALTSNLVYYWRIEAKNGVGNSTGCTVRELNTNPPSCIALPTSPAVASASCPGNGTTLSWPASLGATGYDVYLDLGGSAVTVVSPNQPGTTYNAGILPVGSYAWKVVPINDNGSPTGCTDWTFDINAGPTASISPSAASICGTGSVVLTASGGTSYTWAANASLSATNIAAPTASPTTTTTYTVTVANATGCTQTATQTIAVYAPVLALTASSTPSTLCAGQTGSIDVSVAPPPPPATYCTASATTGCGAGDEFINNVTFGTINNTTVCGGTTYSDFTAISTNVVAGTPGTLTVGNPNYYSGDQCKVWIDLNQNGLFTDAGEEFIGTGTTTFSVPITVPVTALNGNTRMRVRLTWNTGMAPCGVSGYGETEDYTLVVSGGAPSPFVYTYSWNDPNTSTSASTSVSPTVNTNYTVTVSNAAGCTATSFVSVTVSPSSVPTTAGTYTQTFNHADGLSNLYIDPSCNIIANVSDAPNNNILGSTDVTCTILSNVPSSNTTAYYYASRFYEIYTNSPGAADITLFFTQSDFDAYNSGNSYQLDMPTTANDADPNKVNIRVARVIGDLSTGIISTFTPSSVTWNTTESRWEVTLSPTDIVGKYYIFTPFSCGLQIAYNTLNHSPQPVVAGATSVSVNTDWADVVGASDYRIRIRTLGSTVWNTMTVSTSNKNFTNLSFNATYQIQVRVRCSASEQGEYSQTYTFTTPMPLTTCAPPSNIATTNITSNSATLNWNASNNAQSYFIQIRKSGTNIWGGGTVTGLSRQFSNLDAGTIYYYRVRTNCTGAATSTSMFSAEGSFTTLAALPTCIAPTNITASNIMSTSATLNWDASNNAQSYFIQIRKSGTNIWGGGTVTGLSRQLSNLDAGTIYYYRVRTNCIGASSSTSPFSQEQFFTTSFSKPSESVSASMFNFKGEQTANGNNLSWTTLSEQQNKGFVIEHSQDGVVFNTLANVATQAINGESEDALEYSYTHTSPSAQVNHYRLQAVGIDGQHSIHSTVVTLDNSQSHTVRVYPNPTHSIISVTFTATSTQQTTLKVLDMTGRIVKMIQATTQEGTNILDVNLNELAAGMYTLHLFENNKLTHISKIQKQD